METLNDVVPAAILSATAGKTSSPSRCRHHAVRRAYTQDEVGCSVKQYCVMCGEFLESKYYEGKTADQLHSDSSRTRQHT